MKSLKLVKKTLLGLAAVASLAAPLLAGLAIQQSALAQQGDSPEAFRQAQQSQPGFEEYLPIVKVAPVYPPRAAARGLEGYVVVQFTVNETGSTENVTVAESSSTLFENAAIESAKKFKYKPRVENGVPVAVDGVMTRIQFELGDREIPVNPDQAGEQPGAPPPAQ